MRISTTTDIVAQRLGEEQALILLARAGFDSVDYSLFNNPPDHSCWTDPGFHDNIRRLRRVGQEHGIGFGQVHAPFPSQGKDAGTDRKILACLTASIQVTGLLGCPYVVIHPIIPEDCKYRSGHEKALEQNLALYRRLIPIARDNGVRIGLENMFSYDPKARRICPTCCSDADEMVQYMDLLDDTMVACLDTGHANLTGDTPRPYGPDPGETAAIAPCPQQRRPG